MSNLQQYIVGLVIYPGMTALDIVGLRPCLVHFPILRFAASGKR